MEAIKNNQYSSMRLVIFGFIAFSLSLRTSYIKERAQNAQDTASKINVRPNQGRPQVPPSGPGAPELDKIASRVRIFIRVFVKN